MGWDLLNKRVVALVDLDDFAGRLLAVMEAHGLADPFLEQLEDAIQAEAVGSSNDEELRATLNELCQQYAKELKERYPT